MFFIFYLSLLLRIPDYLSIGSHNISHIFEHVYQMRRNLVFSNVEVFNFNFFKTKMGSTAVICKLR